MSKEDWGLIVAVTVGAIVGVFFQKEIVTWGQRVVFVVTGLAVGWYTAPHGMDDEHTNGNQAEHYWPPSPPIRALSRPIRSRFPMAL